VGLAVRLRHAALSCVAALTLVSCGGGGGGGADSGSGTSPTGLVPAAPALGATLLADATTLRPLRAGALWQYRGTRQSGASVLNTYAATASQAAAAGGGVNETQQGGIAGPEPDTVTLSAEGGRIVVREDGAFLGLPAGEPLVTVELRSPVRANDQITLIDRSVSAGDLDGDRRDDTLDVAAWSRVAGWEDVALPELGRTLRALRVDLTFVVQARLASGAAGPPASRVLMSTWYAEGVGVVRRVETDTGSNTVSEERLVAWDGIGEGLGAFEPTSPLHGLSGTNFPWLPPAWAAAAVDNGQALLVVSPSMRPGDFTGITVAALNRRGHLTGVQELSAILPASLTALRPTLVSTGTGAALLVPEPRGLAGTSDLRLHRLGADGRLLDGSGTLLSIGASDPSAISVAGDGNSLWVLASVLSGPAGTDMQLRLQAFDTSGAALGAPRVLDSWDFVGSSGTQGSLSAQGGRAMATWYRQQTGSSRTQRVAVVDGATATPRLGVLASDGNAGDTAFRTQAWPVLGADFAAVWWRQPLLGMGIEGPGPGTFAPRGVTLDDSWSPRRASAGGIDTETLPANWDSGMPRPLLAAQGSRLLVVGLDSTGAAPSVLVHQLTPGTAALSAVAPQARSQRVPLGSQVGAAVLRTPDHVVPMDGRVMVVGSDANRLVLASVGTQ